MADEPDSRLLERFVHGDHDAFESLFRLFESEVFRWIVRIVRDRSGAEDALIETFWRAFRGRARFDASRSFGAWMRRIATNVALNHVRAARRQRSWTSTGEDPPAPAGTDVGMRDALDRALDALPRKLYVVAILALIEEEPYAEIADALDVPIGTVKSRVFRAIRALREELTRLGIDR